MSKPTNHLELYKLLPKTNCRKCNLPSCLAFAALVMKGDRKITDCPDLDQEVKDSLQLEKRKLSKIPEEFTREAERLQQEVQKIDLEAAAQRAGAKFADGKLTLKVLGKDFSVDQQGVITSQCHVNTWLSGPILNYILYGEGKDPVGEWVQLRELKGGENWHRFFNQRCEKPMLRVLEGYTDLIADVIDILDGQPAPEMFDSVISVMIKPLPKIPVLLCYWGSEDGMDPDLHIFFDKTATDNLGIELIYQMCTGLNFMFEKMAQTRS